MKAKLDSLKRSQKLINFWPDSSRKKEERAQINKIRNEKGQIKSDITEIHRIIRDYYKQLYANKIDNPEEMDRCLKGNLPRLN